MNSFSSVSGTLLSLEPVYEDPDNAGCSLRLTLQTDEGPIRSFRMTGRTFVPGSRSLSPGSFLTVFLLRVLRPSGEPVLFAAAPSDRLSWYLGRFRTDLISEDGLIRMDSAAPLPLFLPNGQVYGGALPGRLALVSYSSSTRSIPALIRPKKITVFCP